MARMLQSLRRALGLNLPRSVPKYSRSINTNFSYFQPGDRVVIHHKNPKLTKPLKSGDKTDLPRGHLTHDSIIGHGVRERFRAHKGIDHRVTHPTLEEYVTLTPRKVTPIYGPDANLIASLLDIHVAPPTEGDHEPPLEILESGTGHGSLTLHLARTIQAANPAPPTIPFKSQIQYLEDRPTRPEEEDPERANKTQETTEEEEAAKAVQQEWDAWRTQRRRAVIHTVDVSGKFSAHAEKVVRGFRRGLYAGNVDFHVGPVEDWIAAQNKQRFSSSSPSSPASLTDTDTNTNTTTIEPYLSHVILDMPSADQRIAHVAPVLKPGGTLIVFAPSITQIGECVQLIRKQGLPFAMEKAVELGAGISGGRLWDVRLAVKKSRADPASWAESSATPEDSELRSTSSSSANEEADDASSPAVADEGVLVCRPKVGARVVGGGFVGLWTRIEDAVPQSGSESDSAPAPAPAPASESESESASESKPESESESASELASETESKSEPAP
ncbi:S-adenosyl-L-methionine-dependent methyltransferase [Aspergillus campestris IBT 28561]|uniref:tRNA (adenine(58)-N(1))-methyltransferase catalytic subunit TRM61 n=1 Tax=Aspergillus campestris (strain IBT 28561) TaxID=1392248 RepID=A0A2I1DBR1_ASPC2|nr:S-adenosyl-L-methionine-dependent methyltransferase [Aspergillus campestris IBT 28561]PKY07309.1 S-adenosyl-L-methionine-dependent methyltransferase [Aspergillus campestris IBT 28561]